jgi:hypothetical protein
MLLKIATKWQSTIAFTIAFSLSAAASLNTLRYIRYGYLAPAKQSDFGVYYVASNLVRLHLSSQLYTDAGTGVDPQQRFASDSSVFGQTARTKGIPRVKLYVYPPFLADLLLPLANLSLPVAYWIWRCLNLFAVVISAAVISKLLGFKLLSRPSIIAQAGLFCFSPLWQGLHYGQITMVLLALWSAGILLYSKGWRRTSALLLSIAALLKVTPLLVVVPILIWRDWRWIRWFTTGLVAGCLWICCLNSCSTLLFYFTHVVPPMSAGIVTRANKSIYSALGMIWWKGLDYPGMIVPHFVVLLGKLLCIILVGAAALLTNRLGRVLRATDQATVLAAFALLSLCISPVTWLDSLVIGYILLALLWQRMLGGTHPFSRLLLLFATTASIGSILAIGDDRFTLLQYTPLVLSIILVLVVIGDLFTNPLYANHPRPGHPAGDTRIVAPLGGAK